jgi:hypothetical protein
MSKPAANPKPAYYASLYPHLRDIAREHGYNLVLHGSLQRDLDLVALPWIERPSPATTLVEAIRHYVQGYLRPGENPNVLPHNRWAWSIHLDGSHYLDLSIFLPQSA